MNQQQKDNLIKAAKAVIANEKKAVRKMRNGAGGRCCLCVMVDDANLERSKLNNLMPDELEFIKAFGISTSLNIEVCGEEAIMSTHNDGRSKIKAKSHKQIGEALLKYAESVVVD